MNRVITTIHRHIIETQQDIPDATGEFSALLERITLAAKIIGKEVNRAGLGNVLGLTGDINVQGEEVQKLDKYADEMFFKCLDYCGHVCVMASEENENIVHVPPHYRKGKYVVLFDPLDGSSNIDANVSIGTIFAIYTRVSRGEDGSLEDCLRKGSEQICAGYLIYGSSTMLVYCAGRGVHGFTLDPEIGEFVLSHENMHIPEKGTIYSVNEGNYDLWPEGVKKYIHHIKMSDKESDRPYSLRYIGSMVADLHRTLLYGGIFMYPMDVKHPQGKLRLLFEAAPTAMIIEAAGGMATDGKKRILDIQAETLHQRSPLFLGSRKNVEELMSFLR